MYNDPAFLVIGNFVIYWYGLFIAAALGIGLFTACKLRKQQNGDCTDMLIASAVALFAAFIGSRWYYCWCFPGQYDNFSEFMKFRSGGFSVPGALLGAFFGITAVSLVLRANLGQMLDSAAPATAFTISFGRMAAMFSGEDLGGVITAKALQFFPIAVYNSSEGLYRSAFFAWDAFIVLGIGLSLLWIFRQKYIFKSVSYKKGDLYLLFIVGYFITQGIFEQYRFDPLFFSNVPRALRKLQTTPVSFSLGALFAAVPLAIMILRNIFDNGIKLNTTWQILACGMFYFGYFNKFLRVDSEIEALNTILLVISAFALVGISVYLFVATSLRQINEKPKGNRISKPFQRRNSPIPFKF